MRKKEKAVTEQSAIESIIHHSLVCRLGLTDGDIPYVIPLNFGYRENALYFHTGHKGKKIEILKENKKVCFEFDINHEVTTAENPCRWGMKYQSVVGYGKASFIDDLKSKERALNIIMAHYGGNPSEYPETNLERTLIIRVDIESMTGRQST
ncbi:MAG: pyridoxamine 5'-phosphate oxidase family protein [Deltaproteobacteria bacterium]|nr:pyridoxamine 5'-phosphate oxidase family protein [Deltaproteobacteria bacterium]